MIDVPDSTTRRDRLPVDASRRLSNQVARAYRGTYGARTGLRSLVKTVTRQLQRAEFTPDVITRLIEQCVLDHPAAQTADPRNVVTGQLNSEMLVELARQAIGEVLAETPAA